MIPSSIPLASKFEVTDCCLSATFRPVILLFLHCLPYILSLMVRTIYRPYLSRNRRFSAEFCNKSLSKMSDKPKQNGYRSQSQVQCSTSNLRKAYLFM
ncbi:hypothetical protein BOO28_17735 [Vibrio navarrensis]|nr:hypothetical protein EA25_10410 [Vibrio navarrensis]MBE4609499.1 hypothetical protein [Vibrio navarrensis]